jgi:hypothetical protein
MSYSIANVCAEAGMANILRWVHTGIDERELRNRVKNKMIRPTTIPQTLEELIIEQAIAREALRLAFEQHKQLAVGLKGVQQERTISDTFEQTASGETLVRLDHLDLLVGSGGVLSHAPRRAQAALMLLDAFLPEHVTELAVDSIFMMPQLGVLSTVHPKAAQEVFEKDCLIRLGSSVAPVGPGKDGATSLRASLQYPDGRKEDLSIPYGYLRLVPVPEGETVRAVLNPDKGLDVGAGKGRERTVTLKGGVVGVILDCRGRKPFGLPDDRAKRLAKLTEWNEALGVYPAAAKR